MKRRSLVIEDLGWYWSGTKESLCKMIDDAVNSLPSDAVYIGLSIDKEYGYGNDEPRPQLMLDYSSPETEEEKTAEAKHQARIVAKERELYVALKKKFGN